MSGKAKRYIISSVQILCAAMLAFADLLIKKEAAKALMGKDDIILIKNVLALSYAENTGAAWSMFSDSTKLLSVVTLILLVAVAVYIFSGKLHGKIKNTGVVFVLAGGMGNLWERIAKGYVVDYIKTLFIDFPVFNFADILVVCGVFIICTALIIEMIKDEKQKKQEKNNGAG